MQRFYATAFAALVCVFGLCLSVPATIILGPLDDFQDGTTEGWIHSRANANFPVNVVDLGPTGAGDNALQITSSGTGGSGSRFLAYNSGSDWTGSYTGAGVEGIQFQVNNTGAVTLDLRLALNGPGGWFVTTPIAVTPGGGWQAPMTLDVTAGGLLPVGGATDVNATLNAVSQAEILSSAGIPVLGTARPRGDLIAGAALFDNIVAIPEPATSLLLLIGLGSLAAARSRRRPA